ncbi:hypothetical protein HNQ08_002880 [Deinococcus humi]|uniref:Uncharacterized protein n=1 Tax=Deinococcus humi TaxID=662880 RepID=A0A7W8JVV2_9DEIO|nr:hypothetical protein [Deinococcus humi]MBB5363773.1 hypothetical protein [Deinococcus humi]GGO32047.1 hypothetical protein GCM10008949_28960 [Deinococcus humi]
MMEKEPDDGFEMRLTTTEGQGTADQMGEASTQSRVETLNMLGSTDAMQLPEDHALVGR